MSYHTDGHRATKAAVLHVRRTGRDLPQAQALHTAVSTVPPTKDLKFLCAHTLILNFDYSSSSQSSGAVLQEEPPHIHCGRAGALPERPEGARAAAALHYHPGRPRVPGGRQQLAPSCPRPSLRPLTEAKPPALPTNSKFLHGRRAPSRAVAAARRP